MRIYLWYLWVLVAPFGIRTFLAGPEPFNEYVSVFLYASDIVLCLFVLSGLPGIIKDARVLPWRGTLLAFLALAALSVVGSKHAGLSLVLLIRLLLLVGAVVSARTVLVKQRVFTITALLISLVALIQATVGIMQFTAQAAVGLKVVGESPIHVLDPGTAKVTVEGARLIRAYGTMPDPNILAGFLLAGLCALAYLFLKTDKGLYVDGWDKTKSLSVNFQKYVLSRLLYARIVLASAMFMVFMGLLFTFSRSGWTCVVLALVVMLIVSARISIRAAGRFGALLLIMTGALYYFFSPLILARAGVSASEPSFSYRMEYAKIGIKEIKSHPLVGVGIGGQVAASVAAGRYAEHGMTRAWEYQPVHNLYLLIASEVGVLGALSFLTFLAIVYRELVGSIRRYKSLEAVFAFSALAGLLAFGLFDHFLWDIQAGRLMFWVVIALALTNGQQTTDN